MDKKVLFLTHTDIDTDSRILKQMTCLARNGYSVRGLGVNSAEGTKQSDLLRLFETRSINLLSRKLVFLPRTLRHLCSIIELTMKMFFEAIKFKPSVIHCNDTLVLPLGVLAKIFTGARLIYDAHELESDRNGLSKIQGKLTLYVERMLWPLVDALIVVSPSIGRWYNEKIGAKKTIIVLNSPVFDSGDKSTNYLRECFSIPQKSKIFIYVGILGEGRGIDLITEVFTSENVKASLVFLGYGELAESLKELSRRHDNIFVHDAVPHEQVVPIIKSADFGLCLIQNVSLSDYYCLPNKLFEYCFAGVPVLASDFPDIRALLAEYGVGECCKLHVHDVRDAILRLERSQSPFKFANLAPLSWQAQEQKLVELYQQCLPATNH